MNSARISRYLDEIMLDINNKSTTLEEYEKLLDELYCFSHIGSEEDVNGDWTKKFLEAESLLVKSGRLVPWEEFISKQITVNL